MTVLVVTLFCLLPRLALADWQADHHMHLASADICGRVGDCLDDNDPPAVLAADALRALDEAQVEPGVVFSSGYLYGLGDLALDAGAVARWTRRENAFTASEVSQHPSRLTGFLSVDPLEASAIDEIRHWEGSRVLIGVKLHFAASGVDVQNEAHREQVATVLREAATREMPAVIHIGGGTFGAGEAEVFIREILPSADQSWVQIAHAGGGYPFTDDRYVAVLDSFAEHFATGDPRVRHVLFDLSYVPAPEESAATVSALVRAMREIGLERFVFGSDFNVLTPVTHIEYLERLGLAQEEFAALKANCAPWACAVGGAK